MAESSAGSDTLVQISFALLAIASLLFFGWWLVEIFTTPDMPTALRAALLCLNAGFGILVPTLLYRRIRSAKTDPYLEVKQ